jgi:prepilin-type N-terminal cleavage/methylation domain-containing protein
MFRWALIRRLAAAGFTLIEIMVAMALLTVIVIGLMAMFSQTQRAFRAGMAQTDQLEGGRMLSDLTYQDFQQITPTMQTNGVNFFAEIPNYAPGGVVLPGGPNLVRTNILQDVFFMKRENQYWSGVGYIVRTNPSYYGNISPVGTLYRFETNRHDVDFAGSGNLLFQSFQNQTNPAFFSKLLDGVVEFHVRCYDKDGNWITNRNQIATNSQAFVDITNGPDVGSTIAPSDVLFYGFSNNVTPAYVELEVGVLEPAVLKRLKSIPSLLTQSNFLANHAGNIQLFRQRIAIRNADPSTFPSQP